MTAEEMRSVAEQAFNAGVKFGYKKGIEDRLWRNWGNWVISEVRCPVCLEYFDTDCYSKEEMDKCPNCGSDMRAKEGEEK